MASWSQAPPALGTCCLPGWLSWAGLCWAVLSWAELCCGACLASVRCWRALQLPAAHLEPLCSVSCWRGSCSTGCFCLCPRSCSRWLKYGSTSPLVFVNLFLTGCLLVTAGTGLRVVSNLLYLGSISERLKVKLPFPKLFGHCWIQYPLEPDAAWSRGSLPHKALLLGQWDGEAAPCGCCRVGDKTRTRFWNGSAFQRLFSLCSWEFEGQ